MIITNARLYSGLSDAVLDDAAVVTDGAQILWAGPMAGQPARDVPVIDAGGRLLTPGLIDCHTHLVHAGHRATEFQARLAGASYAEIAQAGGGILSTVRATRAASLDDLIALALPRLDRLLADGVTTLEAKSGYGLDIETELCMLRAARALERLRPVTVVTTWLAAHAVPPEYTDHTDAYVDEICIPGLHRAHAEGLVDHVDGFCEGIAFSPAQIARVFGAARALGLPVKLHAEQLSDLGGAVLAASYGALSADHLEYAGADAVAAMARAETVAVMLPGAFYTLRETQLPPVAAFRAAGVPMAVATDLNPGSSPLNSLILAMNMACTLFRLTVAEAMAGVTVNAARALGLPDRGVIAPGKRADLCLWNAESPADLCYPIGHAPLHTRIVAGQIC
jgi:imidazolonepropionase